MHKNSLFPYLGILVLVTLGAVALPSVTSADMISLLSTVFRNTNVGTAREIDQIHTKNIQTMPVLTATLNPLDGSSSLEAMKEMKTETSIIDGKAFTNENSSVMDGSFNSHMSDMGTSDRISLYTVHSGDTLEEVAQMFGVTTNTILWANDLKKGSTIKKDQVLVILPISGIKYTVEKNDTLEKVADKFGGDVREIAQFNNLEDDQVLEVGGQIMIPDADGALLAAENKKSAEESKKNKAKIAKSKSKKGSVSAVDGSLISSTDSTGYFTRPVVGGIKTQGVHGNNGVDLASGYGTPILAAASGQVIVSKSGGWGGGYGTYIVIKHSNGTQTLYGHLSQVLVSSGDVVSRGQQIGKMGNTGKSTGVHLHFEVRGGKNPF